MWSRYSVPCNEGGHLANKHMKTVCRCAQPTHAKMLHACWHLGEWLRSVVCDPPQSVTDSNFNHAHAQSTVKYKQAETNRKSHIDAASMQPALHLALGCRQSAYARSYRLHTSYMHSCIRTRTFSTKCPLRAPVPHASAGPVSAGQVRSCFSRALI